MRPVARRHAVFSFALAAMFLASQVSSFTHDLLFTHVTCLEHGERIHANEALSSPAPAPGDSPEVTAASTDASGPGHEHCLATAARREESGVPPARQVEELAPGKPTVALAAVDVAGGTSVALLRLAPKGSPPA